MQRTWLLLFLLGIAAALRRSFAGANHRWQVRLLPTEASRRRRRHDALKLSKHFERMRAARLAALVVALTPSPTWAAFSTPFTLSPAGPQAELHQVAVDADGNALVVWQSRLTNTYSILARKRSAAGALGPIQTLANGVINLDTFIWGNPQVAVDAEGDALVVWEHFDGTVTRIQARGRSAAGALGPIQTLSAPGNFHGVPQVAVDADGDALIVWQQLFELGLSRIHARARSAGGALGPILTLSATGAGAPQVAMDAGGNALVVWAQRDGTARRIQARSRSASGTLGPIQILSPSCDNGFSFQVAVNANGDALVVWQPFVTNQPVQARARSAAGVLSPIQTLSPAGGDFGPQVAVDADGNALIVWERTFGQVIRVEARARSAAGALGPILILSAANDPASFGGQVAVDADGDALVVWETSNFTYNRIRGRARSAAGVLGPILTLSAPGSFEPRVALNADHAIVAWRRFDVQGNGNPRIHAAAGP